MATRIDDYGDYMDRDYSQGRTQVMDAIKDREIQEIKNRLRNNFTTDTPSYDINRICGYISVKTKACIIERNDAARLIKTIFMNMKSPDIKRIIHDLFTKAFPEYEIERSYNYDMDHIQKLMEAEKMVDYKVQAKRVIEQMVEERKVQRIEKTIYSELVKKDDLEYFKNHLKEIEEKTVKEKDFLSEDEMEV